MLRVYLIEDIESVVSALKKEGYGMVDHAELFRRLNPIEAAEQSVQTDKCPNCTGDGYVTNALDGQMSCVSCGGTGIRR